MDKDSKESVSAPPPENLAPLKECLRITVNGFCGVGDRTPLVSEDNNKGSSSGSCWVLPGDWGVEHEWWLRLALAAVCAAWENVGEEDVVVVVRVE